VGGCTTNMDEVGQKHTLPRDKATNGCVSIANADGDESTHFLEMRKHTDV
jgi:hypothetical protein